MEYHNLHCEKADAVLKVIFNHPEKLNALTPDFIEELNYLLDEIEATEDVKLVIFTGEGKAFIAGADISAMKEMTPEEAIEYSERTTRIYGKIGKSKKIFIAAVNGFALGGGCEFALACDLIIASTKAKFGFPEVSLGIFPGGGGTQRLPRLIGLAKAKELIFTGKTVNANKALEIGIVNEVTEEQELMKTAEAYAKDMLKNSRTALALSKEAINSGCEMSLEHALELERNLFGLCFSTYDQKEGMTAFLEKRDAKFK